MDELVELFSVMMQLEKGALGLFFEMNYLVGIVLTGYITWFIWTFPPPVAKEEEMQPKFDGMYGWIYFQYIYMFFSLFIVLIINCIFKNIDGKISRRKHD